MANVFRNSLDLVYRSVARYLLQRLCGWFERRSKQAYQPEWNTARLLQDIGRYAGQSV
jgi:hypothetical protein